MTARTAIPLGLLIAFMASACGARTEQVSSPPGPRPPALYTVGKSLLGLPRGLVTLAAAPVAPLAGWLTPAAVPSPDGRYIAYNAWQQLRADDPSLSWGDQGISPGDPLARPSIRLHDLQTGADRAYVSGGFSVAWRADGAIAYFKGAERSYRAAVPYVGHVFVRKDLESDPERWTTRRGRYVVAGWAGSTLLAYRERPGEQLDVLALDSPGRIRLLSPSAGLVAISPDGREALVEHGPAAGSPRLQSLSVANGARLASLDLTTVDPAVGVVGYSGDWEGDLAVAPSASGIALFRLSGREIELVRALRVPGGGVAEPRFAGFARVTGWATTSTGTVFVDCIRATARCGQARPLPQARGLGGFPTWRRPVYNPSRPQEGAP